MVTDKVQMERLAQVWQGAGWTAGAAATIALVMPDAEGSEALLDRFDLGQAAMQMMIAATGPEQWWDTAEGEAVGAVEEEIYSFCLVFQGLYDRTAERVALSDVPWIPSQMKEVVQVDIGCDTVRSNR